MAATTQISVSQAAWTAVIARSNCKDIRVTENRGASGFPNSDFLINKTPAVDSVGVTSPPASPTTNRIQAGAQYTFPGRFFPGQIAGYVQMVANVSTTFDQDEGQL